MAISQSDIDNLDQAIATAELTVTVDGKDVTYRSVGELKRAREHLVNLLSVQAGTRRPVFYFTPAGRRD
jgi:hypothetical protein